MNKQSYIIFYTYTGVYLLTAIYFPPWDYLLLLPPIIVLIRYAIQFLREYG